MSKVFITGSADGLGHLAARRLIDGGHEVLLHGRSAARAQEALEATPGASGAVAGDLASITQTRELADAVNAKGPFDAVIHNAGVYRAPERIVTEDGLAHTFQINALAPYLLTALITLPQRLIYVTSGLHQGAATSFEDLAWEHRRWDWAQAYADSKFFDILLAFAVARRHPEVRSNAVKPGWVPTKMGGPGAPDDLEEGVDTQVWLAAGETDITGQSLFHREPVVTHPGAHDPALQDRFLDACEELTGVRLE